MPRTAKFSTSIITTAILLAVILLVGVSTPAQAATFTITTAGVDTLAPVSGSGALVSPYLLSVVLGDANPFTVSMGGTPSATTIGAIPGFFSGNSLNVTYTNQVVGKVLVSMMVTLCQTGTGLGSVCTPSTNVDGQSFGQGSGYAIPTYTGFTAYTPSDGAGGDTRFFSAALIPNSSVGSTNFVVTSNTVAPTLTLLFNPVFQDAPNPAPEASTWGMIGLGLITAGLYHRRTKQKPVATK